MGTAAPLIILDGLLGLGAKPPLRDPIRAACRCINHLRANKGAYVFAVDLPTGLDGRFGQNRSRLRHRGFYRHDWIRKARIAGGRCAELRGQAGSCAVG